MFPRVRASEKQGKNKDRLNRHAEDQVSQDAASPESEGLNSEAPVTYPDSLWQLIGMALRNPDWTQRLNSIASRLGLVIFVLLLGLALVLLGVAVVVLALHGVHTSYRFLFPVGLFTSASAIVIATARAAMKRFRK
jgi:hypothetical protein